MMKEQKRALMPHNRLEIKHYPPCISNPDRTVTRYYRMEECVILDAVGPYSYVALEHGMISPSHLTYDPGSNASVSVGEWREKQERSREKE